MSQPGIASLDQVDPQDIWRKDRDHFLHPWTHFDSFKKDGSLVMGRGEGAYVYDIAGQALSRRHRRALVRQYGLWPRGDRRRPSSTRRAASPSSTPSSTPPMCPPPSWRPSSAGLAPGALNHVFFTCGGSTANDTAVRLIQYYQSRRGKKAEAPYHRAPGALSRQHLSDRFDLRQAGRSQPASAIHRPIGCITSPRPMSIAGPRA